ILSSNATLSAAFAPSIVTQPASQQVPAGSTLSLTVSVIGPGPMSYQWRKDGTNLSDGWRIGGSAAVSLSVSNLQSADMGNYSVVVSNTNGPTTSSNALVALWPLAVWGAGTTNTTTSPNYGQSVIPAGLTNVAAVAGGLYHSLALKANGTVAAWGAGYTNKGVAPQYGQSVVPAGLSNVVQVIGGYYHSLALVADGRLVGWGAGTNNTGASPFYGQLIIPDGLTNVTAAACGGYHSLALKPDGTVAAWGAGTTATGVNPEYGQSIVPAGLAGVVDVAAGGYHNLALKPDGTVVAWGAGAVNTGVTPYYGQSMVPDGLSNVVMTAAGGYHSLALKLDGTVAAWGDNTYGQSSPPAGLSNVVAIAAGRYNSLALKSDGILATWGAGTNNTGANPNFGQGIIPPGTTNGIALASGGFQSFLLKGDGRPCLTVQPPSQTVAAGANVSYAAMAAGNPPLSYQWKLDGAEIPGATASVLCLTNLQFGGSGQYAVLVSNALGSVASSNAMLTILSPPVISQQPSDQTAIAGAPVTFTVQAAGSAPLAYQWSFNSASIPGATQSSYSIAAAHPTNAGIYSAVVSNAYGTAPSSSALLAVILPPAITTQPSSQSAAVGGNASFSVQADSATPLNYQWYYGQTNLLAGADEAALSLTNVQPAQAGDYFVVVNNIAGSATSTLATLTVLMPTNILSGPKFTPGGEFQFNVAGNPGSNYVVEGSTNLADWFPLLTNTSPFTFTDADAANLPTRFYRVHQTP
ncbi:MAG: immunoglobulin domain-containing protein, partial [Verrucomicrobiota bacterium]